MSERERQRQRSSGFSQVAYGFQYNQKTDFYNGGTRGKENKIDKVGVHWLLSKGVSVSFFVSVIGIIGAMAYCLS